MRRGYLFWGFLFILLAALFVLKAVNILDYGDIWNYFWSLALIIGGAWLIIEALIPRSGEGENESMKIDLQGAKKARVKFSTGMGRMMISSGAPAGQILTGTKAVGMSVSTKLIGDQLEIEVGAGPSIMPFIGPSSGVWRFHLNGDIPINLEVGSGASELDIDLSDLQVSYGKLEMGASSVNLTTPKHAGNTSLAIEAGAAKVDIHIPAEVEGRIRIKEGVSALAIDEKRFPRQESGSYQSINFDKAKNRVEMDIEAGVGKITIN